MKLQQEDPTLVLRLLLALLLLLAEFWVAVEAALVPCLKTVGPCNQLDQHPMALSLWQTAAAAAERLVLDAAAALNAVVAADCRQEIAAVAYLGANHSC